MLVELFNLFELDYVLRLCFMKAKAVVAVLRKGVDSLGLCCTTSVSEAPSLNLRTALRRLDMVFACEAIGVYKRQRLSCFPISQYTYYFTF